MVSWRPALRTVGEIPHQAGSTNDRIRCRAGITFLPRITFLAGFASLTLNGLGQRPLFVDGRIARSRSSNRHRANVRGHRRQADVAVTVDGVAERSVFRDVQGPTAGFIGLALKDAKLISIR